VDPYVKGEKTDLYIDFVHQDCLGHQCFNTMIHPLKTGENMRCEPARAQHKGVSMKPQVLQLSPILIPAINDELAELYEVHRFFEIDDQSAWLSRHGASVAAVITGGHTGISRTILEQLPNLKVVAVNGVGTDAVDLAYCRTRGLPVTATIGALTEDVADMAIGLLIAACRNLCAVDSFVRDGQWALYPQPGAIPLARRFSGMRVGIVGMGRVGRAVSARAAAFGCPIRYTDLCRMDDVEYGFVPDLIDLARGSDALVLCAAADNAAGIVDAAVLDALGPRGFLVNVARGKLVNEAHLAAAVQAGRIAGVGLDVFADEPNVPLPLRESQRTTLQAHRASATWETREAMARMVMDGISQALAGQRPAMSLTT
jgi:lactate dehydrogenase-like 2-hydroxyacid dehydrogenase